MSAVNEEQLLEAFARVASSLEQDPLFEGGDVKTMEAYLDKLPSDAKELFARTLQGCSAAYRYAGLILMAELVRTHGAFEKAAVPESLVVAKGDVSSFNGALHIKGNLILEPDAIVVVAGDLRIDGNFLGAEQGYSLLAVAGTMTSTSLMTRGELLVGKSLAVKDSAFLTNNDYPARSPRISARVLIQNDRLDLFGRVYVGEHITGPLAEWGSGRLRKVCKLLGIGATADLLDLESAYRASLMQDIS